MALVTVIKYAMFWMFGFALFILLTPVLHFLRYDTSNNLWGLLPADMLAWGDQLYAIWFSMLIIIPAVLIITAWREAERKAAGTEE